MLGCVNFAAIITTAVFRFNTMGRFAALSLCPSKYEKPFDYATRTQIRSGLSDEHTYESDAHLIFLLWITQLFLCFLNCCVSSILQKPQTGVPYEPSQFKETARGVAYEESGLASPIN